MTQYGVVLPEFPGLPGFDCPRVEAEWSRFRSNIPEFWKFNNDGREFQVGDQMQARGLSAKYPVILVPGVISTVRPAFHSSLPPMTLGPEFGVMVDLSRLPRFLSPKDVGRI